MIKKYNDFLNEKISDKLSGFNAEEIKNQFENDKIDIIKYYKLCKDNNIYFNFDENVNIFLQKHNLNDLLNLSIDNNYLDGIKYVFEHNNSKDSLNNALIYACKKSNVNIVKYLIEIGADVNYKKDEPIKSAVFHSLENVKILVEHGANIHINNEEPLRNAYFIHNLDIVKYLNEQGSNIHLIDSDFIFPLLDTYDFKVIIYILDNYKTYNFLNRALLRSIQTLNTTLVQILIDKGADINYKNNLPLSRAIIYDNLSMVKLLIKNNVNITKSEYDYVNNDDYIKNNTTRRVIKELINNNYKQNEEIDLSKFGYTKEQLIKEIIDVYNDENKSIKSIDKYIKTLDKLNEKGGILYRIIYLESARDFKMSNLKDFSWFTDIETADRFAENINNIYIPFIVTAEISKKQIDIKKSIENYIEHPLEGKVILIKQPFIFNCKKYVKE